MLFLELPLMAAKVLKFSGAFPDATDSLGNSGKAMWVQGRDLWNSGTLTVRDLDAWKMLCESFDELDHCDEIAARDGEYSLSSQGTYSEHPVLRRRRATEQKILRYQKLFGLVPDARKKRPTVQQGVATRKR
jgi:P27 family predicted phage terminase small subunit